MVLSTASKALLWLLPALCLQVQAFSPKPFQPLLKTKVLPSPLRPGFIQKKPLYAASIAADDSDSSSQGTELGTGTATIPNEIFNLVKGIVGAGVLSLPAGAYGYR
eukprot:scaffold229254_cov51-Attheya_sp.AAC.3